MANTNYITADVKNGYGKSFLATGKFPIVAKRAWKTYADALEYAGDIDDSCFAGAILAVINDTNSKNNGVYLVESCPTAKNPDIPVVLTKVGSGEGSMALPNFTIKEGTEDKVNEATEDNVGQIIYITTGTDSFPAGPYIVTGSGTVAKLGTTTASGDLAGDVTALKGNVSTLQTNVQTLTSDLDTLEGIVGNETEGLVYDVSQLIRLTSGLKVKDVQDDGTSLVGENGIVDLKDYATSEELTDAYDELLGKINGIVIPEVPEYSIEKSTDAESGYAASYKLMKGNTQVGDTINIPKDMVVSEGVVRTLEDSEITEDRKQGLYIVLTIANNNSDKLYIPVDQLVDEYTEGSYITITDRSINVDIISLEAYFNNKYDTTGAAATVQDALDAYIESNNKALEDYLKKADIETELAEYAKTDDVADLIAENNKSYTATSELDTYIAWLGYFKETEVNDAIDTKLASYLTSEQVNNAIDTKLASYSTTEQVNNAIDTKLASYLTSEQVNNAIDTKLVPYATTEQVNTALESYVKKDDLNAISIDEIDAIIGRTKIEE